MRRSGACVVLVWVCALGMLSGCGREDDPSPLSDAPPDLITDLPDAPDLSPDAPDASLDAPDDADMADAPDDGPACDVPEAQVATQGAYAAQLAQAPARCGALAYQWITAPQQLGEVLGSQRVSRYTVAALEGLAQAAGVVLPRELRYSVDVKLVRYMTQDRGALIEASTLVAAPNVEAGEPLDTLLLLHGTTGFTDACAPSTDLQVQLLAGVLASIGYVVVAPDYIGLRANAGAGEIAPTGFIHPYLVGEATAIASLDAARAASRLGASGALAGNCPTPRVAVVGGSQGGHAALWVDRLQPYYAQEMTLLGTVATVPPADLVGQMTRALLAPVSATANTIAFLGTAASWYGLDARLSEVFVPPLDVDVPAALGGSCNPQRELPAYERLEEVFQAPLLEAAAQGRLAEWGDWGCMTAENGLTTTSIPRDPSALPDSYGILYVLGESDQLVHSPIERDAFDTLCETQQLPMQFLECAGASHTAATAWALPELLRFVEARQQGQPMDATSLCARRAPSRCEGTP